EEREAAARARCARRCGQPPASQMPEMMRNTHRLCEHSLSRRSSMAHRSELAFIDRTVSDLHTLLTGLRPGVEAVLLDSSAPAAVQMAQALRGRSDLSAIHVLAHGRPGEVSFGAGPLSLETIDMHATDLAAIGQTLGDGSNLQLWSCETGAGERGAAFV